MRYCADNWFLLKLFNSDEKAKQLMIEIKEGKSVLILPVVTVSEFCRSLFGQGKSEEVIDRFLDPLLSSQKISILTIDLPSAKQASKNSISFGLSLIDSYVATLAKLSDCNAILSADQDLKNLKKRKFIDVISW